MNQIYPSRLGNATRYSAKNIARPVNFVCLAPQAQSVTLIGDFNDWNPTAHPMTQQPDGGWFLQIELHHGNHCYQFLVDGKPMLDPKAQGVSRNASGERVSMRMVS